MGCTMQHEFDLLDRQHELRTGASTLGAPLQSWREGAVGFDVITGDYKMMIAAATFARSLSTGLKVHRCASGVLVRYPAAVEINASVHGLETIDIVVDEDFAGREQTCEVKMSEERIVNKATDGNMAVNLDFSSAEAKAKLNAMATKSISDGQGRCRFQYMRLFLHLRLARPVSLPADEDLQLVQDVYLGVKVDGSMDARGEYTLAGRAGLGATADGNADAPNVGINAGAQLSQTVGPQFHVASISAHGGPPLQHKHLVNKPMNEVLLYVDKWATGVAAAKPEYWQVLFVDPSAKPKAAAALGHRQLSNGSLIMIGNPGAGKSTTLNAYIGASPVKFKSGDSAQGIGMTRVLDKCEHKGRCFMDTPGLADVQLREQAAKAIDEALQTGGTFSIVFCITHDGGRLHPDDLTTMQLVFDAVNATETQIGPNDYAIFVNKNKKKFLTNTLNKPAWISVLHQSMKGKNIPLTDHVHFAPYVEELDSEQDVLVKLDKDTQDFLDRLPVIKIKPDEVERVKYEEWDKQRSELMERLATYERQQREEKEKHEEEMKRVLRQNTDAGEQLLAQKQETEQMLHEKEAQRERDLAAAEAAAALEREAGLEREATLKASLQEEKNARMQLEEDEAAYVRRIQATSFLDFFYVKATEASLPTTTEEPYGFSAPELLAWPPCPPQSDALATV